MSDEGRGHFEQGRWVPERVVVRLLKYGIAEESVAASPQEAGGPPSGIRQTAGTPSVSRSTAGASTSVFTQGTTGGLRSPCASFAKSTASIRANARGSRPTTAIAGRHAAAPEETCRRYLLPPVLRQPEPGAGSGLERGCPAIFEATADEIERREPATPGWPIPPPPGFGVNGRRRHRRARDLTAPCPVRRAPWRVFNQVGGDNRLLPIGAQFSAGLSCPSGEVSFPEG